MTRRRWLPAAAASLTALALTALGVTAAHSATPPVDGYYTCTFDNNVACSPATIPTVTETQTTTETATVTATATATVTATPSADPATLLGQSYGGSGASNVQAADAEFPEAQVGRYFFSGAPTTFANSAGLRATKPGEPLIISFKIAPATVTGGADDQLLTTAFADWANSGHPVTWVYEHEPENNGFTAAAYKAAYAHLLQLAQPYRLTSAFVLMGQDLSNGTADTWAVPGTDYVGIDLYNGALEAKALAFAKAQGRPLIFPEFGDGPDGSITTDTGALAFAKAFVAGWDSTVKMACWFNAHNNDLSNLPQTLAYLRTLP